MFCAVVDGTSGTSQCPTVSVERLGVYLDVVDPFGQPLTSNNVERSRRREKNSWSKTVYPEKGATGRKGEAAHPL